MPLNRHVLIICSVLAISFTGCTNDTSELKQRIAELEKKIQKQDKDLRDFSGKFAPPKDFSADIQRMEDQQDRISQMLKTKVDPVNTKLEEFRTWAQEAQQERETVGKKLKTLEQLAADAQKKMEAEKSEAGKLLKEYAAQKKQIASISKSVEDLTKSMADAKKEIEDNNKNLVNAVKKTLPKVKEAAVAELKDQYLTPMEHSVSKLKEAVETDKKGVKTQAPVETRDSQALLRRIKDLEEIVTSQKSFLLEIGGRMHDLEQQLQRMGVIDSPPRGLSRR